MKNKVGIVTWYHSDNYGSQLQAYALSQTVNKLGFDAEMLTASHYPIIKRLVDGLLYRNKLLSKYTFSHITDQKELFTKKYLKEYYLNKNNRSISKHSSVICGSDQIWAPIQYSPYYMLSFVPDNVNKISYAASIGLEQIPDNLVDKYKYYIGRINHVSVRENTAKELLQEKCSINSTVVLDPTFLIRREEWDIIKKEMPVHSKYIFCYFLKKDHHYRDLVKEFAEKNDCVIYGVSENPNDDSWMHLLSHKQVGPCEFIGLISGAETVITDSYHGTIFSMLYHKPFILFERFNKEDKICQNSRIEQLKKYFGIDNRIVNPNLINQLDITPIDYSMFESSLTILREKSMCFLKNALL